MYQENTGESCPRHANLVGDQLQRITATQSTSDAWAGQRDGLSDTPLETATSIVDESPSRSENVTSFFRQLAVTVPLSVHVEYTDSIYVHVCVCVCVFEWILAVDNYDP